MQIDYREADNTTTLLLLRTFDHFPSIHQIKVETVTLTSKMATPKVLIPMADYGHDPTGSAPSFSARTP